MPLNIGNSLEKKFYSTSLGTTDGSINDLENKWLVSKVGHAGVTGDLWNEYLRGLGYSGSLNDMMSVWSDSANGWQTGVEYGTRVPYANFYTKGSYSVFALNWSAVGTPGVAHNGYWDITPTSFPNKSRLTWEVPQGTIDGGNGVWGYHHIDHGNYDSNDQEVDVSAAQICDISVLSTTFDFSYTGSPDFGLLHEMWLTKNSRFPASSSSADALWEIGVLLYGDQAFHLSGTLIGTSITIGGISYTARSHGTYITFMPQTAQDVLVGSFDWKAALNYLVTNDVLSGSEWWNGVAFGVEPGFQAGTGKHSGVLTVNSYAETIVSTPGVANANYLGTNVFANGDTMTGWSLTGLATPVAATDKEGGSTAFLLLETAVTDTHEFYVSGAFTTVPTGQTDYVWFEDVKMDKTRTKTRMALADGSFASQIYSSFNHTALTHATININGTGLTLQKRQIIDLGGGWTRTLVHFRKAAGITQLFTSCGLLDASDASTYLGVVTNGFTTRARHRLVAVA